MDNKLNYQQARRIRGQSLSDLFAEQLIGGSDFIPGFKKSIGLKTQARIKGIKEKFDPLNIAKALTGGSRIGPAILGKLLGRDRKDIEYFAGRARPVGDRTRNMTGVSKGDKIAGIKAGLSKILNFLEKSRDTDIKMIEKENNFKEEKEFEDKRRHNELMKALKSLIGKSGSNKNDGGRSLMDFFGDMKDKLKQRAVDKAEQKAAEKALAQKAEEAAIKSATKNAATEVVKDAAVTTVEQKTATKVGEVLAKGGEKAAIETAVKKSVTSKLGSYFMKDIPFGIGLLFSVGAGTVRATQGDWTGAAAELAAGAVGVVPFVGTAGGIAINVSLMARDVYKDVFKVFPEDDDPALRKQRAQLIMSFIQASLPKMEEATAPEGMEFDIEGNVISSPQQQIKDTSPSSPVKNPGKSSNSMLRAMTSVTSEANSEAKPITESPKSEKLSSAIQTNNDLILDSKVAEIAPISTTTNVQAPVKSGDGFKPQLGFASVRNQDDTLQRLLLDSTRVV